MDGNVLGVAIADAIKAARPPSGTAQSDLDLETMWKIIATEIVNEVKKAETITNGVQTGPGSATGTVTG